MSYIGHGLSHAIFGGAVVSYILQWNFYLGAGLWGFIAALLINATARKRQIGADAAIGVITTASFAIGVALISKVRRFTKNFEAALFGNILGVTPTDLWIIAGVFVFTIVVFFFCIQATSVYDIRSRCRANLWRFVTMDRGLIRVRAGGSADRIDASYGCNIDRGSAGHSGSYRSAHHR